MKQAQQLAEQLKKVPAPGGLQDLTVAEFKDLPVASATQTGEPAEKAKQEAVEAAKKEWKKVV